MNFTVDSKQVEALVRQMTKRMEELTVRLSEGVQAGAPSLAELEQAVLQGVKETIKKQGQTGSWPLTGADEDVERGAERCFLPVVSQYDTYGGEASPSSLAPVF